MSHRFLGYLERERARIEQMIARHESAPDARRRELASLVRQKRLIEHQAASWRAECMAPDAA